MNKRDKRLIKQKKRLSAKYDDLFQKIIDILIKYRLQTKSWNITELKKYNRLVSFNSDIKNLLKNFNNEELELINQILLEEFKENWKDKQKYIHKRVKFPQKNDINNIVNYRNAKDGLTVQERDKRNAEFLQYKIYSTVTKNATVDKNFDKLINVDLIECKNKYVKSTATRQLQDDITQAESLSTIFLVATLNNNYKKTYNNVVNNAETVENVKNDVEEKAEVVINKTEEKKEERKEEKKAEFELIFVTQQDNRVCSMCQALESKIFKDDGSFTIPANTHPNCRCELYPFKKIS